MKKKQELTLDLKQRGDHFVDCSQSYLDTPLFFIGSKLVFLVWRCHEGLTDCHPACLMVDCDCATKMESGTNQSDRHACLRHAGDWSDTKEMGYLRQDLLSLSSWTNPVHISNPALGIILWPLLCDWVRILAIVASIWSIRLKDPNWLIRGHLSLSASFSSELFMSL